VKPTKSSLYREIENLILWFIPIGNALPKDFALRTLEHYVCACNSYMGFLKYNNSYALRRKLFGRLEYFWKVVYVSRHFDKIVIHKRFRLDEKLLTFAQLQDKNTQNLWK
jgi:hypothetical protein